MANTIFDEDNSNLDGSVENVDRTLSSRDAEYLWHYYNGLDENVTVTVYGTHKDDDTFSEAVQLNQKTVSSGGNAKFDTLNTDAWDQIRIELNPAADPSSGSLTVYEMVKR